MYIHVKQVGYKSVNLWYCIVCEIYYKLEEGNVTTVSLFDILSNKVDLQVKKKILAGGE